MRHPSPRPARPRRPMYRAMLMAGLWLAPAAALAGRPVPDMVTCPVGGETFEVTNTLSCTSFGPHLLSLAPNTSCDFITHLPQCPGNKLPIYAPFEPEEIAELEVLVETPEYLAVAEAHSKFYLAWWIATKLGNASPERLSLILVQGIWWDTDRVMADPVHLSAAREAMAVFAETADPESAPVIYALTSWVHMISGDLDGAKAWLARAEAAASGIKNELADEYLPALRSCIASGDPASPLCAARLSR